MGPTPGLHPLHIGRALEVIPVLGFAQPAALAGRFTGLAARGFRTVALVVTIAWIGPEQLIAIPTLMSSDMFHWWTPLSTPMMENLFLNEQEEAPRKLQ